MSRGFSLVWLLVSTTSIAWLVSRVVGLLDYEQSLFFLKTVKQNARHAKGHACD